jgi:tetratricopeptide (TPR) repeat protein
LNKTTQAREALTRAQALAAKSNDHLRRHVEARALQMAAEEAPGDTAKLAAYRRALDAAIAAQPNDAQFVLLRGLAESPDPANRGQGSTAAAIPYYERALKLAPQEFAAHHFLAHAYENSGRMKEAEAAAARYAAQASGVPHAVHMHGHELRRLGRISEAITRFEAADKLERAYIARENVPPGIDWHFEHNLDLLAASYRYVGQMKKAEAMLLQAFTLPTNLLVQAINKREWPAFLVSRNRGTEALAAAQALASQPNAVVQASGHIEAAFAYMTLGKPQDTAKESNAALQALSAASGARSLVTIELEALQGEFLMRTGQRERGRRGIESAAQKWRSLRGPDAWAQALFRLEGLARVARAVDDWPLAARMAQLMLEHDPGYPGTHYALALVAKHEGNTAAAAREFDLAVKGWANADKDLPELAAALRK